MIRNSNGNILENGDDVIVIRDLKLGKDIIKQGTKAKNIQILDEEYNGHNIQGRVDGFGVVYLKSSVVKK
ncbi:alkylphosphonate utilization protein [Neofamilia massiliensis]|uniref:alkylphosphonate utilization protein n=1 Tax=Neofamilia massiliensis TaxID=1673724 RepID=UPI003119B76D